jgi:hypothetical protein
MSTQLRQAIAIAQRAVQLDNTRQFADALAHYEQCLDMMRRARALESEKAIALIDQKVAEYSKRARELHQMLSASAPPPAATASSSAHPEIPDDVPDFDDDDDANDKKPAIQTTKATPPVVPVATPAPPVVVVSKAAPQPAATPAPANVSRSTSSPRIVSETVERDELVLKTSDDPSLLATLLAIGQRATEADRNSQFDRAFPLYHYLATALMRLAKLESDVRARDTMIRYVKQYTDRAEQLRSKPDSQKYRALRVEKYVEERVNVVPGGSVLAAVQGQPPAPHRDKSPNRAPPPTVAAPIAATTAAAAAAVPAIVTPPGGAPPPQYSSGHLAEIERVWADVLLVPFVAESMRANASVSALQH